MGLFVYTQKGSIISMVDLPTTEIIEPSFLTVAMHSDCFFCGIIIKWDDVLIVTILSQGLKNNWIEDGVPVVILLAVFIPLLLILTILRRLGGLWLPLLLCLSRELSFYGWFLPVAGSLSSANPYSYEEVYSVTLLKSLGINDRY